MPRQCRLCPDVCETPKTSTALKPLRMAYSNQLGSRKLVDHHRFGKVVQNWSTETSWCCYFLHGLSLRDWPRKYQDCLRKYLFKSFPQKRMWNRPQTVQYLSIQYRLEVFSFIHPFWERVLFQLIDNIEVATCATNQWSEISETEVRFFLSFFFSDPGKHLFDFCDAGTWLCNLHAESWSHGDEMRWRGGRGLG